MTAFAEPYLISVIEYNTYVLSRHQGNPPWDWNIGSAVNV